MCVLDWNELQPPAAQHPGEDRAAPGSVEMREQDVEPAATEQPRELRNAERGRPAPELQVVERHAGRDAEAAARIPGRADERDLRSETLERWSERADESRNGTVIKGVDEHREPRTVG